MGDRRPTDGGRTVLTRYRRLGADLPFGDPRPSHGAEMEGYFWRFTSRSDRRVLVVLCGVNRDGDSSWATVAAAMHPEGLVVHDAVEGAWADEHALHVRAGTCFRADRRTVAVSFGTALDLHATIEEVHPWPARALHGGGLASVVPLLNQYWHPHILGGRARVEGTVDGRPFLMEDADVYAEKNWGRGFPRRWWWGQAQGFADDVCVAFTGGVLELGPLAVEVGGVVVRVGDRVVRLAPPLASVRSRVAAGRWAVDARGLRHRVHIRASTAGTAPAVLPVPVPAEHRNLLTDFEHLAGHLTVSVVGPGLRYHGTSHLAGLEVGSLDRAAWDPPDAPARPTAVRGRASRDLRSAIDADREGRSP